MVIAIAEVIPASVRPTAKESDRILFMKNPSMTAPAENMLTQTGLL